MDFGYYFDITEFCLFILLQITIFIFEILFYQSLIEHLDRLVLFGCVN